MALITAHTAPNFAFGNYFRILKAEFICTPFEPENPSASDPHWLIRVGFYANEAARHANTQPMYVHVVEIPMTQLPEDPRDALYSLLLQSPLFAGTNATSDAS